MNKVLWFDCETTGIKDDCTLLEVSAVVTDSNYEILDAFTAVITATGEAFDQMDAWCKKTHTASGLWAECSSDNTYSVEKADRALAEFVLKHWPNEKPLLTGNSIHFDRRFISKYLRSFDSLLHYRMIDASAIHEAYKAFKNITVEKPTGTKHRGMDDIKDSIRFMATLMGRVS